MTKKELAREKAQLHQVMRVIEEERLTKLGITLMMAWDEAQRFGHNKIRRRLQRSLVEIDLKLKKTQKHLGPEKA